MIKRMVSILLCIILATVFFCSCSKANSIPFTKANYETTQDEMPDIMGRAPDDEYDGDNGFHVLQYNGTEFDGYEGLTRYCFNKDGSLQEVLFVIEPYDQATYDHFDKKYTAEYGDPSFENNAGKVWKTKETTVGLAGIALFGGTIIITYAQPADN